MIKLFNFRPKQDNLREHLPRILFAWVPFAITVTLCIGAAYLFVQQSYRQSANDPQIQLAQDVSNFLKNGNSMQTIMQSTPAIELSKSLAPFLVIYDTQKLIAFSSVTINGKQPNIPAGVLDNARNKEYNAVTWQANTGDRSAIIATYYSGKASGYVVVGRSIKEVEKREDRLLLIAGLALLSSYIITFFMVVIRHILKHKFHMFKYQPHQPL